MQKCVKNSTNGSAGTALRNAPSNGAETLQINRFERAVSEKNGSSMWVAENAGVVTRIEVISLPTYLPALPDKNPIFLEKRVYQGSTGKVYPLPFIDRISEKSIERKWKAVWIEN